MYKILLDEQKLDEFINFLPDLEENEVYYLALFARHKYSTIMPNLKDNQLNRFTSKKEEIKEKILRLECPIGAYKRDGIDIPQEALAVYIAPNPRNLIKANKELLVELAKCFAEGRANFNPLSLARTAVHNATNRKVFVDFDFDHIEPEIHLPKIKENLPDNAYRILKTRGGFHVLVLLANAPKANWFKAIASLEGCDVKGSNTLFPVAGCSQGNFCPYFRSQYE
jgi:hypothetical protein